MRESYPSTSSRNSPAPPDLPPLPPERFQFSLKGLLAYMIGTAVLAGALHYPLRLLREFPAGSWNGVWGLLGIIILALAAGALLYCLLRLPVLLVRGGQLRDRWGKLRQHRRDLEAWARSRAEQRKQVEPGAPPPGE